MPNLPKHQAQLGRGPPVPGRTRGSRDCGPRTWQMGVDYLTKGQKVPGITELRRRGNVPGPQPTNVQDAKLAVESYQKIKGRKPLRYYIKSRIADVKTAVAKGKFVQCAIDYGKFNDLMHRTGDPNFRGGHSIGILGQKTLKSGRVRWLLWDPLDDNRRGEIPQGPRWVDRWKVIRSMESFAGGKGRCYAGVFGGGQKR